MFHVSSEASQINELRGNHALWWNRYRHNEWRWWLEILGITRGRQKLTKRCLRRVKKVLKSNLNGEKRIAVINTWAVSLLRYSDAFTNLTKEEIRSIDRETRNLLIIYRAYRLSSPRNEGRKGLITSKDSVEITILGTCRVQNAQ